MSMTSCPVRSSCGQCGASFDQPPRGRRLTSCKPCRSLRQCTNCPTVFAPVGYEQTCSERCRLERRRIGFRAAEQVLQSRVRMDPCRGCGFPVGRPGAARFCVGCADERERVRLLAKGARRRGASGGFRLLTLVELGVRDGWRCHVCRRRVLHDLVWPHPGCGTRDHLIPVSEGGTDDPANVALAHLRCNMARGAGGAVQLLLVG